MASFSSFFALFYFTSSIAAHLSYAVLTVTPIATGEIQLRASTCQELKQSINDILTWTQTRGYPVEDPQIRCKNKQSGSELLEFNIAPLLSPNALQWHENPPVCDGPNCFNLALLDLGLNNYPRHTGEDEWAYFRSKHCRQVDLSKELPKPGDLGAIQTAVHDTSGFSIDETHGFIYVGALAFTKNGMASQRGTRLMPLEDMLASYEVPRKRKCWLGHTWGPDCPAFVTYYRCNTSSNIPSLVPEMKRLEKAVSNLAQNGVFDPPIYELGIQLQSIRRKLSSVLKNVYVFRSLKLQLIHAAFYEKYHTVKQVGVSGAKLDLNVQNSFCQTFLHRALLDRDFALAKDLIRAHVKINVKDVNGVFPLMLAIVLQEPSIIELLIQRGAEVNLKAFDGLTPLMASVLTRNVDLSRYLLQQGAEVNALDKKGHSALYYAFADRDIPMIRMFLTESQVNPTVGIDSDLILKVLHEENDRILASALLARLEEAISEKVQSQSPSSKRFKPSLE
jgi:hypothetical protein